MKATFKGNTFYIKESKSVAARNVAVHEYLGTDESDVIDMGKASRPIEVDGYVSGSDYALTRQIFERLADQNSEGKLIHPYIGMVYVKLVSLEVSHFSQWDEYCEFRFVFRKKTPEGLSGIRGKIDSWQKTIDSAKGVMLDAIADFNEAMSFIGEANHLVQTSIGLVDTFADALTSVNGLGVFAGGVRDLGRNIDYLRNTAKDLVSSPKRLVSGVIEAFDVLDESLGNDRSRLRAVKSISKAAREIKIPNIENEESTNLDKKENDIVKTFSQLIQSITIIYMLKSLRGLSERNNPFEVVSSNNATREAAQEGLSYDSRKAIEKTTGRGEVRLDGSTDVDDPQVLSSIPDEEMIVEKDLIFNKREEREEKEALIDSMDRMLQGATSELIYGSVSALKEGFALIVDEVGVPDVAAIDHENKARTAINLAYEWSNNPNAVLDAILRNKIEDPLLVVGESEVIRD